MTTKPAEKQTEPGETPTEVAVDDQVEETVVDESSAEKAPKGSEVDQKGSPEPKLITMDQAEKMFAKRQSALDSKIAELTRQVTSLDARARASAEEAVESRKRADDAELSVLGDNADGRSLFEARVALREEKTRLDRAKQDHADELAEAKMYRTQKLADEVASADPDHEVDATLLVQLTDGSREAMEKLAKVLPKKTVEDKVVIPKPPVPDSGKGKAGQKAKKDMTVEELEKLPMGKYIELS